MPEIVRRVFFYQVHLNPIAFVQILNIFGGGERQDAPNLSLQIEYSMLTINLDDGRYRGVLLVRLWGGSVRPLRAGTLGGVVD